MKHIRIGALLLLAMLGLALPAQAAYVASGTIANGASLSGAINLTAYVDQGSPTPIAIIMPAAWTSASITIQASTDGCTTFQNMFIQAGTEYTITSPAASEYIVLTPSDLLGLNCLKIRSGTAGSPVSQGADRIIKVVLKPVGF